MRRNQKTTSVRIMAGGSKFFWVSLLLFLSAVVDKSIGKITPRFPSSVIQPERFSLAAENRDELYEAKYFTQTLDHFNFNPQSYQTFQQRYLISHKHWGGAANNSPIFVYMGNEGDIEWFAQNTGFMFETAPHFRALVVFIEHRYYGKSTPFGGNKDVEYRNASRLGYLSSTQALADYATLILDLKNNLTATDSPVFVFGGSYGGMLAAWFRLKYPHVTMGALASSAPILYFDNITSPNSFNTIITNDFRSESENCYKVIKGSWEQIENAVQQAGGLDLLQKSFRLCRNNVSASDIRDWLAAAYTYAAMTDYPTPSNFFNPLPAYPIKQMCKAIDDSTTGNDTFAKVYDAANIYYNYSGTATCYDVNYQYDPRGLTGWQYHGHSGWRYQACTEMVMQTDGSDEKSMFPAYQSDYSEHVEYCRLYYGIYPRPHWITTEFGGHNIERVLKRFGSNIIFFNGLRDPWSGAGVLKNISKSIIAIVAKEGAHHVDLRFSTKEDPKWLQDVRKQEISLIAKWLSKYYDDLGC